MTVPTDRSLVPTPGKYTIAVCLALLIVSFYHNLGIQPLYLEEPRRAIVALEMIFSGQFVVPTTVGELYYNKPPLYSWLIAACVQIAGSANEWIVRLPSVTSFLLLGLMVYLTSRKYLGEYGGLYSALLLLISADMYYYFSSTAELDLFYSLVTYGCLFSIFHFEQRESYVSLYSIAYLLAAVGFLTKGMPSIAFLGISLVVWLIVRGKWRVLFHPAHLAGLGVFGLLVGGYLYLYSLQEDLLSYLQGLFGQAAERTQVSRGLAGFVGHAVTFPLRNLLNLLPTSLLLIFAVRRDLLQKVRENPFIFFACVIFVCNVIIYLLAPGARTRYIYPLYPFLTVIAVFFFMRGNARFWMHRVWRVLVLILLIVSIIGGLAGVFHPALSDFGLLAGGMAVTAVCLLILFTRSRLNSVMTVVLLTIAIRYVFNFVVLPTRAADSGAQHQKEYALEIHAKTAGKPLYLYDIELQPDLFEFSYGIVFYLESLRNEMLEIRGDLKAGNFYILKVRSSILRRHEVLYRFSHNDINFELIYLHDE